MSAPDEVRRRLSKLLELARRGEGGEQANAERMLAATLRKYGLTLADLEREEVRERTFICEDAQERRLLLQVLCRVLNVVPDIRRWKDKRHSQREQFVQLTDLQYAEATLLFDIHREQWKKERDRLLLAYFQRHELYRDTVESDPPRELTAEQVAELRRTLAMADILEGVEVRRRIGHAAG